MFGCSLIYHHSSLAFFCECPISMVMLLDNVKAYYTSCELLSTFQILDNQCLWWENMEGLYWKAFHPGSFLLSCWCYDEYVLFSHPGIQSQRLVLIHFENTMEDFATHSSSIDLSMCFPSNRILPTFLYHSLDIKLLALIIALAIMHREKPVRASEGSTEIIHRVGNTLFWPLEGSRFVHQLCRERWRIRRKSEWSVQFQEPATSMHGW